MEWMKESREHGRGRERVDVNSVRLGFKQWSGYGRAD